jgi:PAS domain S-box-containing protein
MNAHSNHMHATWLARRARQGRLRLLAETMRDTLWSLDPDTLRFNYLSPQSERLLGYSIEELTKHPIDYFLASPAHQPFKVMIGERYSEARNNPSGDIIYYTDEWEHPCKDGSLIWLEVISHFVHNPNTHKLEMLGVMRDITERKRAEDALRLSEERHRLLAENARDVIWTMELDGSISYISPSIEKVRGFTVEEAMQQSIEQIHPPQSQAITLGYFQRLYEAIAAGHTPDSFRGELEYWCKDGSTFWTEVMAYPILNPDGSFAQILGVTRDISERKRYELELQQARIEAEKAAQAKSDFLANMSHEIRSPMNAIMGLTELLLDDESTPWKCEYLNSVQNASKTLLSLINDILDYSKIEAGHLHFEHSEFSLSDVIRNTLELFKLKFDEKGLKLITELDENLPQYLIGDSLRLGQVLNNLVNNAIKFTEKGEIRIIVRASEVPDSPSKTKLLFSVHDTGIGISACYMPHLFSPFTQAETSISRRFGGTGLGLSIAKRLVDMMEGDISASSAEGQGSVFTFTVLLDRADALYETPRIEDSVQRQPNAGPQPLEKLSQQALLIQGANILVVEDDAANQLFARRFLERLKLNVTIADNGYDAIEWVKKRPYDLILMDLMMPGIDGFDTTRQIRALPEGKTLPIIAATATVMKDTIRSCMDAGMNDHIAKPMDLNLLTAALLKWITPKQTSRTADEAAPASDEAITLVSEIDRVHVLSLCAQLEPLLAQNMVNAKDIISQIESVIMNSPWANAFHPVSHAARYWRFDDALEALKSFQTTIQA